MGVERRATGKLGCDLSGVIQAIRVRRRLAFPAVAGPLVRSFAIARLVRDQNCPVE